MRIKSESLPARCEICHQSDQFNPQTSECQRCVQSESLVPSFNILQNRKNNIKDRNTVIGLQICMLIGQILIIALVTPFLNAFIIENFQGIAVFIVSFLIYGAIVLKLALLGAYIGAVFKKKKG